jgi:hypothetical protein
MASAATLVLPNQTYTSAVISSPSYTPPTPSKNYLDRCVEEIRLSDVHAKQMDKYATIIKVRTNFLAYGVFIPAAVTALVLTGIFAPVYIPLAMITIAWATDIVLRYFKRSMAKAEEIKESAQQVRDIAKEYQAIQARSPYEIQDDLIELAPNVPAGQQGRFTPLLAHHNYWKNLQEKAATEMQDQIQKARCTGKRMIKKRIEHYKNAAIKRQEMLQAKVYRAFAIAVMNNPGFQGHSADICSINDFKPPIDSIVSYRAPRNAEGRNNDEDKGPEINIDSSIHESPWLQRALYENFGDPDADAFVIFNNDEMESISSRQVEQLTAEQLATQIIRAM